MSDELELRRLSFSSDLEIRAADDDPDGEHFIRGMVAPFNDPTPIYGGEVLEEFAPSAFRRSIHRRGGSIPLLEEHVEGRFPIGVPVEWQERTAGQFARFKVPNTDRGREAIVLARDGYVTGLSVGFNGIKRQTRSTSDGRRIWRWTEVALVHVGLVSEPAYDRARVLEARARGVEISELEELTFDPDDSRVAPRLARFRAVTGRRGLR